MAPGLLVLGGVVYLIAALGYAVYDVFFGYLPAYCNSQFCVFLRSVPDQSTYLSYVFTTLLAVFYFVDALIYWLALCVHARSAATRFVYWSAELGNLLASTLYLVSQCLYWHTDFLSSVLDIYARIVVIQAATYAAACLLWAINAFQYVATWRADVESDSVKRVWAADLGFWGEFFNVWPSLGYFATSMWGLIVLFPVLLETAPTQNWDTFSTFYINNQSQQLIINLAWDIGYTIDALLYIFLCCRPSGPRSGGNNYVEMDEKSERLVHPGKTYY